MCEVYNIVLAIFGLFPFLFSAIYPFAFFLPFFFFFSCHTALIHFLLFSHFHQFFFPSLYIMSFLFFPHCLAD